MILAVPKTPISQYFFPEGASFFPADPRPPLPPPFAQKKSTHEVFGMRYYKHVPLKTKKEQGGEGEAVYLSRVAALILYRSDPRGWVQLCSTRLPDCQPVISRLLRDRHIRPIQLGNRALADYNWLPSPQLLLPQ
jgi:hypothetical protein